MSQRKPLPPAASLHLTERALRDLREIEQYSIKEWGRKVAGKYLDDFAAALDRIRANPGILQLEPEFSPGLYFYRVKKHVLVCDYQDQIVIVLTIIHTSMDLPVRLQELEPRLVVEIEFLRNRFRKA